MSAGWKYEPQTRLGHAVHKFEENTIALALGLMTALTFVNVIMRYAFNTSIIWSLEVTLVLFAWLVLFGISYGFKITAHLGVDALINVLPSRGKRMMAIVAGILTLFYGMLLFKGAWDYWAPFADLPPTTGRWFPTGLDWGARGTSYFETDQIPMLSWLRWLEDAINYGESYAKLPRMVPYIILPIASALIFFRIAQCFGRILRGEQSSLIVSHEAEEAVEEAAALNRE
jgi:C4-dicarboxylate transporter, DctQ subunit